MKKDIYNDHTYLANNPTWHAEDAEFKVKRIEKLLNNHPIPFKRVCEVGCGSGEILALLQKRFPDTDSWTGYEISEDALNIAAKKSGPGLKFVLKDIGLEDPDIYFDLMLVIDVIEHLDNYFAFLDTINRRSKYFIFHIPLDMCVWSLLREGILIESKQRVGHIHNFTEDFIKSILHDHGFRIVSQIYTEPVSKVKSFKQTIIDRARKILFRISPRFCTKTLGGYSIMLLAESTST